MLFEVLACDLCLSPFLLLLLQAFNRDLFGQSPVRGKYYFVYLLFYRVDDPCCSIILCSKFARMRSCLLFL